MTKGRILAGGGAVLLAAGLGSQVDCPTPPGPGPSPTPTVSPTPTGSPAPDPSPICPPAGAVCGCWHRPPGEPWQELPPCPEPEPTPAPTPGCVLSGEPGSPLEGYTPRLGAQVNAAMAGLVPGCDVGGRCVLTAGRQEWQGQVAAALREAGLCAGQHTPGTDELAVATVATSAWEGWHVYAGSESGPGTVVWSPQAARGAYAAPAAPSGGCPAPVPDLDPVKLKIGAGKHNRWVDATIQTQRSCDYCTAIGMGRYDDGVPRCGCPMRREGDPERPPCEMYAARGATVWETDPPGVEVILNDGNPWQATCTTCTRLRVCTADKAVCSPWVDKP